MLSLLQRRIFKIRANMRHIVKQPEEQIVHRILMNAPEEKGALDCS